MVYLVYAVELPRNTPMKKALTTSVSTHSSRLLVGRTTGLNEGSADIFLIKATAEWVFHASLVPIQYQGPSFGFSVGLHGNRAAVGDPLGNSGFVYMFISDSQGFWTHETTLICPQPSNQNNLFGYSLSVFDGLVVIGAPNHDKQGSVFAFREAGNRWILDASLKPKSPTQDSSFGNFVSLSSRWLLIGSPEKGSRGSAYVFERVTCGEWREVVKLSPPLEQKIISFGISGVIHSSTAVIGALGQVFVFKLNEESNRWVFQQMLSEKMVPMNSQRRLNSYTNPSPFSQSIDSQEDNNQIDSPQNFLPRSEPLTSLYFFWPSVPLSSSNFFGNSVSLSSDERVVAVGTLKRKSGISSVVIFWKGPHEYSPYVPSLYLTPKMELIDNVVQFGLSIALDGNHSIFVGTILRDPQNPNSLSPLSSWSGTVLYGGCSNGFGVSCSLCSCLQKNGHCDSGILGNGECVTCNQGFWGKNCHEKCNCLSRCNEGPTGDGTCGSCKASVYGRKCAKNCTCDHGICNEGPLGSGNCLFCDENWFGKNCDQECTCLPENGVCNSGPQGDGTCIRCNSKKFGTNCEETCTCQRGTCSEGPRGSGLCTDCTPGYWGLNCQEPCTCVPGQGACNYGPVGRGVCFQCWPGFTGINCEVPCTCIHGVCDYGVTGVGYCNGCWPGWWGINCQFPCTCVNGICNFGLVGNGLCVTCWNDWWGLNCEFVCTCRNGRCNQGVLGDGKCAWCLDGWWGINCELLCTCQFGKCSDGPGGTGKCIYCYEGWDGENCDRRSTENNNEGQPETSPPLIASPRPPRGLITNRPPPTVAD